LAAGGTSYEDRKERSQKSGLAPGTLVHIGEQKTEKMLITLIEYDETSYEMREMDVLRECLPYKEKPSVTWLNIEGLHEVSAIEEMSSCYGFTHLPWRIS